MKKQVIVILTGVLMLALAAGAMAELTPQEFINQFVDALQKKDAKRIGKIVIENPETTKQVQQALQKAGQGKDENAETAKVIGEALAQALQMIQKVGADDPNTAEMDRLNEEGQKASYSGKYPEALAKLEKGLELAKKVENKKYIGWFLGNIGLVYNSLREYDNALSYHEQALAIHKEIGDRKGEGNSLSNIGVVYEHFGEYDKALSYHEQALAIRKEIGDKKGEGNSLANIGLVYADIEQNEKALSYNEQALAIRKEIGDRNGEAGSLKNIGVMLDELGRPDDSLSYSEQALMIYREIGSRSGEAAVLGNIGLVYEHFGEYDKALSYCEQSLVIYREIGGREGEGNGLSNIGMIYDLLGHYDKSLVFYNQSLAIHKEIGDRRGEGSLLGNIGLVYYELGQYEKALNYYMQALVIHKETSNIRSWGNTLGNIGNTFERFEQYEDALEHYEQALAIHKEIGDRRGEGYNFTNIGVVYANLGQYEKAENSFAQSMKISSDIGAPDSLWLAQRGLAEAQGKLEKYDDAVKHYEQSLDTIEKVREKITEKEAKMSFMQEKIFVYDELIELLRTLHPKFPDRGYDRKSIEIFERKQGRTFLEEMGKSGARNFAGIPDSVLSQENELSDRLAALQSLREKEGSKKDRDMKRIREIEGQMENLKAEQLKFQEKIKGEYPDYYALKYPKPVSLKELQEKVLKDGEIMLIYNVMEKMTCMWAVSKDRFSMHSIDISAEELTKNVEQYRNIIISRSAGAMKGKVIYTDPKEGKLPELYALLFPETVRSLIKTSPAASLSPPSDDNQIRIGPAGCAHYSTAEQNRNNAVKPYQTEVKTLYIIPTGPLYLLPFEALKVEGRYFIEDYSVAYLSSASLLKILRDSQSRRKQQAEYPLLAFANPVYGETKADDGSLQEIRKKSYSAALGGKFDPLPETEDEVKAVRDILKAPESSNPLWLRESASRSNVITLNQSEKLDDYRYIVFSCHGILPNEITRINQPALVLSHPDPKDRAEGFLTMADVFGIKLNAQLIALSACNTGRGDEIKGEGTMGLTRAFMYAGTPAVSVTLWSVESQSSKQLSIGLFENLRNGKKRADALRDIKLRMIRGDEGEAWKHPFFWAPVVVFGDGQ